MVVFLDDEALHLDAGGLDIFGVDAVVPHHGVGHGDDLALVGGVGENFLVARHGGVEHHLSQGFAGAGKRTAS